MKLLQPLMTRLMVPVEADTKYFLISFYHAYDKDEVRERPEALAKRLGVSSWRVTRAVPELVAAGYLLKNHTYAAGSNGDPRFRYRLAPRLLEEFEAAHVPLGAANRVALIERLLITMPEGVQAGQQAIRVESDRLLLAVLLAHADEFGVVRRLGSLDIFALTGIKAGTLKKQVQRLRENGFIRHSVHGTTGAKFFGKVPGTYWLNLDHELFEGLAAAQNRPIRVWGDSEGRFTPHFAVSLYTHLSKIRKGTTRLRFDLFQLAALQADPAPIEHAPYIGLEVQQRESLSGFFQGGQAGISDYLQMKLEEWASLLLCRQWQELDNMKDDTNVPFDNQVLARMVKDMFPRATKAKKEGLDPLAILQELTVLAAADKLPTQLSKESEKSEGYAHAELVLLFYRLACLMAFWARMILLRSKNKETGAPVLKSGLDYRASIMTLNNKDTGQFWVEIHYVADSDVPPLFSSTRL